MRIEKGCKDNENNNNNNDPRTNGASEMDFVGTWCSLESESCLAVACRNHVFLGWEWQRMITSLQE